MRRTGSFALFVFVCWLNASGANAGAFSVVPQMVKLSTDARSGVIEIRNDAANETIFQVETLAWADSTALDDLEPTREILAVPAVFRLPAGERQIIRVAARQTGPAATERSYRLLISEVPPEERDGGVVFALRINLPVFFTPDGAQGNLQFDTAAGRQNLQLTNTGNAHLRLKEVRVMDQESGRLLQTVELEQPAYLLPQRSRSWVLAGIDTQSKIRFEVDTQSGGFQHSPSE